MVACMVCALEFVHNNGILHRDIKPENLVFDSQGTISRRLMPIGYMHLTDFGIARVWNPDNASDTSGTPGYMGKRREAANLGSARSYVQEQPRGRR